MIGPILGGLAALLILDAVVWRIFHRRSASTGQWAVIDANIAVITVNVVVIAVLVGLDLIVLALR